MQLYTVTSAFDFSQLGLEMSVGMTVGKISSRQNVIIGSTEYPNLAVWNWLGSADSLNYLTFSGTLPDPIVGGSTYGFGGTQTIPSGADQLTISGIDFGFIPTSIVVSVEKPDGTGSNIFATIRENSITELGFIVDFSAPAPDVGYILAYFVAPLIGQIPAPTSFMGGTVPMTSGVPTVTVVQAFGFIPVTVTVSVTKPDTNGVNIFATVNSNTITATGFTVDLSGTPPTAGYILNYFVKR